MYAHPSFDEVLDDLRDEGLRSESLAGTRGRCLGLEVPAKSGQVAEPLAHVRRAYDDSPSEAISDHRRERHDVYHNQLRPGLTVPELRRLRRQLARACHPDRVPVAATAVATERMALVNRMIDDALAAAR